MDDSVSFWKGATLPNDPFKPFGVSAGAKQQPQDISLADVLIHFQKMLLSSDSEILAKEKKKEQEGMLEFGMIGFYRFNGFEATRAYLRTHVFSTVILNLDKLVGVDYESKAYVWEDIQFNRDAAAPRHSVVSCKCHRFQFGKPQLREGGCAELVARPPDQPLVPPPEQLPELELPVENTPVHEPEGLKEFLERLDFRNASNNPLAFTYLSQMNDAFQTLDGLTKVWLTAVTRMEGRTALASDLQAAGIKGGHVFKRRRKEDEGREEDELPLHIFCLSEIENIYIL